MPAVMRDDLGMLPRRAATSFAAERAGVRRRAAAVRHAGLGIERADVVEALLLVGLRGPVALALAGERVDDDRPVDLRGRARSAAFERGDVVAVDRAYVGEPERRRRTRRASCGSPVVAVRRDTVGA